MGCLSFLSMRKLTEGLNGRISIGLMPMSLYQIHIYWIQSMYLVEMRGLSSGVSFLTLQMGCSLEVEWVRISNVKNAVRSLNDLLEADSNAFVPQLSG